MRRASGSLFTLDQHNGDKSKASSEAGIVGIFLFIKFFVSFFLSGADFKEILLCYYVIDRETVPVQYLNTPFIHLSPHNVVFIVQWCCIYSLHAVDKWELRCVLSPKQFSGRLLDGRPQSINMNQSDC